MAFAEMPVFIKSQSILDQEKTDINLAKHKSRPRTPRETAIFRSEVTQLFQIPLIVT
jgi:hypothetical protein